MQSFFVSSTFKDMQGERDALHRIVMPRLREQALQNGDNIQFVDLRWGIATADMDSTDSTAKILSVCLQEVKNCKPYMIVLLGQRYGWIPPVEQIREAGAQLAYTPEDMHISVTELEIRFGMYVAKGQLDRCIFCLRDPMEEEGLTPEQREIYLCGNEEDAQRMAALREKIESTPGAHVIHYRLDSKDGKLTGYEAFSEQLYDALEGLLTPRWEARKQISWQQKQREEDAITAENHLRCFVERKDTLQQIIDAVRYTQVVLLEGEGGCGKSALMAKLDQMYRQSNFKSAVYFCGASSGCMTTAQLMRLMLWRLDALEGSFRPEVEDDRLQEYFRERMRSYKGEICIFFIDAIDQLAPDENLFGSRFLPPEMSASIRLIISTTGAVRVDPGALTGFTSRKLQLQPPAFEELRTILRARFASEHKQISQKVEDKLLEKHCTQNMLGMEIMVRRLVMLGQEDFDEIARLEQTMGGAAAIDSYLIRLIEGFSDSLPQLIIDYFFDVSKFLDGERHSKSAILLYIIGILQHGISPLEMEDLAHCIHTDDTFSKLSPDHPWRHFWDPIAFARLKRFMGGLLVERSNGNIDFSHRLLREALRSASTFQVIAPVLRSWLVTLPSENIQRLENILPICRLAEENNKNDKAGPRYDDPDQVIDYFFSAPIRDAANLEEENPEESERQLEILERSVVQDITGGYRDSIAASYCDLLSCVIRQGASADHYTVWFFGSRVAPALARLGQAEKAWTIRIMTCILSHLHKQKADYEAGATQFEKNWTTKRKRRFLLFHSRILQMMADLMMDFRLGNVEMHYYDHLPPEAIFEKGLALADECIREDPNYRIFHLRKASLYAAYAKQTAQCASFGLTKSKQETYVWDAMTCIRQAFEGEVTPFYREYALYIMAICMEAIHMEGTGRLFGARKILGKALALCRETWELVNRNGNAMELPVDVVARFQLAWSRLLDARGELPFVQDPATWQQDALEHCAKTYLEIRNRETSFDQAGRKYLGLLAVQACLMMHYGHGSRVMADAGYSRGQAYRYFASREASYFRAEARLDFASRWHWALMLCAECYGGTLKPAAGLECAEKAIALLEQLRIVTDKKGYIVDLSTSRIDHVLTLAMGLKSRYKQDLEQK